MRVPPNTTNPVNHSESIARGTAARGAAVPSGSSQVNKKQFENPISSGKAVQGPAATRASDIMADVKLIAEQVKSGGMSKEEASRQFAALVIEKRHDLSDLGKNAEQVKEAIKNIAGDDPRFVAKLNAQLQQLTKA